MEIVEIKNKELLGEFLKKQKHTQFLQSWEWGVFQENNGNQIFRLAIKNENEIIAVATLIKKSIGLGKSYFYCPRGPVFDEFRISNFEFRIEGVFDFLISEIKKIVKKQGVIFLRFEPLSQIANSKSQIAKTINLQPAKTLLLDLSRSEEELLADMHKKTRYNIRLSEKKKVSIVKASSEDFEIFWTIMNETSDRDGFRIHGKAHYRALLNLDFVKVYFAKHENKVIAAGIFSFFGDTVTYMHGASSNEYRNIMSPFLLQWELIKTSKEGAYKFYDFYGIDEEKWPGVTRFKKGFGGFEQEYLGTFDIIFNSLWYNAYKVIRFIRRKAKI